MQIIYIKVDNLKICSKYLFKAYFYKYIYTF